MNTDEETADSQVWTRERTELLQWMRERAPTFAPAYEGAVKILFMRDLPGRVHMVCHVVRDIYDRLPLVLGGQDAPPKFSNLVRPITTELYEIWSKHHPNRLGSADTSPAESILVPRRICEQLDKLVALTDRVKNAPKEGDRLALTLCQAAGLQRQPDPLAVKIFNDQWDYFIARAHLVYSIEKMPGSDDLIEKFKTFERAFHSFIGGYFTAKEALDAILQHANFTGN